MKVWRDLEVGEEIRIGDRCCGLGNEWFSMDNQMLILHTDAEGSCVQFDSFPFQRKVSLVSDVEPVDILVVDGGDVVKIGGDV